MWAWPVNSGQQPPRLLLLTAHSLLQTSWGLIVTLPLKLLAFVAMRLSLPWNHRFIHCRCLIPIENQHGSPCHAEMRFTKAFYKDSISTPSLSFSSSRQLGDNV